MKIVTCYTSGELLCLWDLNSHANPSLLSLLTVVRVYHLGFDSNVHILDLWFPTYCPQNLAFLISRQAEPLNCPHPQIPNQLSQRYVQALRPYQSHKN